MVSKSKQFKLNKGGPAVPVYDVARFADEPPAQRLIQGMRVVGRTARRNGMEYLPGVLELTYGGCVLTSKRHWSIVNPSNGSSRYICDSKKLVGTGEVVKVTTSKEWCDLIIAKHDSLINASEHGCGCCQGSRPGWSGQAT